MACWKSAIFGSVGEKSRTLSDRHKHDFPFTSHNSGTVQNSREFRFQVCSLQFHSVLGARTPQNLAQSKMGWPLFQSLLWDSQNLTPTFTLHYVLLSVSLNAGSRKGSAEPAHSLPCTVSASLWKVRSNATARNEQGSYVPRQRNDVTSSCHAHFTESAVWIKQQQQQQMSKKLIQLLWMNSEEDLGFISVRWEYN